MKTPWASPGLQEVSIGVAVSLALLSSCFSPLMWKAPEDKGAQ